MGAAVRQGSQQESGEPAHRQEATRERKPIANVPIRCPHISPSTSAKEFVPALTAARPPPLPPESAAAEPAIATMASRPADASPSTAAIVSLPGAPRPVRRVPAL